MYLDMVIMLTAANVIMEGVLAWNIPGWRTFTKRWPKKVQVLWDFAFSLLLSYFLGKMFQVPPGLVVFMSAVCSTVVSFPMYPMMDWVEKNLAEIKIGYQKVRQTLIDTAVLVYKILRLITIPIRMCRWVHQQYQTVKISIASAASE